MCVILQNTSGWKYNLWADYVHHSGEVLIVDLMNLKMAYYLKYPPLIMDMKFSFGSESFLINLVQNETICLI